MREELLRLLGGVRLVNGEFGLYEQTTEERLAANAIEKHAIAKKALQLIDRPCVIFVDGSTTCLAFCKLIDKERSGLTIVTHSAQICLAMRSGRNTVLCAGGELEPRSLCFVGPDAETFVRSIFIDVSFVSATGFIPGDGTYESEPVTFRIKRGVAERSTEVVLLADHTKFGRRALSKVLDASRINNVVTDDQTSEVDVAELRRGGTTVTVAECHLDSRSMAPQNRNFHCPR